jgi:hypothetical protein
MPLVGVSNPQGPHERLGQGVPLLSATSPTRAVVVDVRAILLLREGWPMNNRLEAGVRVGDLCVEKRLGASRSGFR